MRLSSTMSYPVVYSINEHQVNFIVKHPSELYVQGNNCILANNLCKNHLDKQRRGETGSWCTVDQYQQNRITMT